MKKMAYPFSLTCIGILFSVVSFTQQVYDADNGITASGSSTTRKVSLGGNLTGNTTIGLGAFNLYLTGTGNMGIRTASPQAPLHVYKNVSGNYNPVMILEDALSDGYIMFQMKGTGRTYHLGLGNAGESYFGLANKFFIWDQNAQAPRLVVDPNGNIGIGTTSPTTRLSLAGPSAGTSGLQFTQLNNTATAVTGNGKVLSLDANGNVILVTDVGGAGTVWSLTGSNGTSPATHYLGTSDNQPLVFRTNAIERSRLLTNGNWLLGGTTDDGYRLDVNGTARIQSTMKIGSFVIAKGEDVSLQGVHQGIRVDDATYTPIRFQTSNQGGVSENFVFENAFGSVREFYGNASIIRIKQGWGNPNTTGYNVATLRIDNVINITSGSSTTVRGIYYNPTLTSLGGATHIAYENTTGSNLLNTTSGNTVIGTSTDNGNKLQVSGNIHTAGLIIPTGAAAGKVLTSDANGNATWQTATGGSGTAGWALTGNSSLTAGSFIGTTDATALVFKANNIEGLRVGTNGNVGIGTSGISSTGYKLFVEGNIRTRKIRVDADTWADYVFEEGYPLPGLTEVEQYIQQHKHLPDVPSAAEIKEKGIDLSENQTVLLRKIEELTLYVIEQNKMLKQQQQKIEVLEKKMAAKKKK